MNFQKHSSQESSGKYFKIYQPYDENFSKLLIDESLSWKKSQFLVSQKLSFGNTKSLLVCTTAWPTWVIILWKCFFSLLDNAPIYPTRYIVGCADQKNLFQYFEALCSKSTVLWTVKRKCWPSEPVRLQP